VSPAVEVEKLQPREAAVALEPDGLLLQLVGRLLLLLLLFLEQLPPQNRFLLAGDVSWP
jgi:hypothetical protein